MPERDPHYEDKYNKLLGEILPPDTVSPSEMVTVIINYPQMVIEAKTIKVTRQEALQLVDEQKSKADFILEHLTSFEESNMFGSIEGALDANYASIEILNLKV